MRSHQGDVYIQRVCLPCNCVLPSVPTHSYKRTYRKLRMKFYRSETTTFCQSAPPALLHPSPLLKTDKTKFKRSTIVLTSFAWLYLKLIMFNSLQSKSKEWHSKLTSRCTVGQWRCWAWVCIWWLFGFWLSWRTTGIDGISIGVH